LLSYPFRSIVPEMDTSAPQTVFLYTRVSILIKTPHEKSCTHPLLKRLDNTTLKFFNLVKAIPITEMASPDP
jgi:hypothetical protein